MSGLIGRKIGMTSIFDENGKNIPCTVIELGPCVVTQVRTKEVDGYEAYQLGFDDARERMQLKRRKVTLKKQELLLRKKSLKFKILKAIMVWVMLSLETCLLKETLLMYKVLRKVRDSRVL